MSDTVLKVTLRFDSLEDMLRFFMNGRSWIKHLHSAELVAQEDAEKEARGVKMVCPFCGNLVNPLIHERKAHCWVCRKRVVAKEA